MSLGTRHSVKVKVLLLQNIVAPYRVPLFERIGTDPDFDFTLVQLAKSEPMREEWAPHRNYRFKIKQLPSFAFARSYHEQWVFSPLLFLVLILEHPDVVIIGDFSFASLLCGIAKLLLSYKVILWFEGTRYTESDISQLRLIMRKLLATTVDGVIVAGALSKEYLCGTFFQGRVVPIYTAYNCIDNARFSEVVQDLESNSDELNRLRSQFGKRIVLYVGRLMEAKGVRELLRAYRRLAETNCEVSLLILGSGPMEGELRRFCRENRLAKVFFLGFVPAEQIARFYAIADVFVILSHKDRNPLVVFEALAAGLPIVASRMVGNTPEFVRTGFNGLVVDPFNEAEVAESILKFLADDQMRKRCGLNSRALSEGATYENAYLSFRQAITDLITSSS